MEIFAGELHKNAFAGYYGKSHLPVFAWVDGYLLEDTGCFIPLVYYWNSICYHL